MAKRKTRLLRIGIELDEILKDISKQRNMTLTQASRELAFRLKKNRRSIRDIDFI